jgi:hypothetical protein
MSVTKTVCRATAAAICVVVMSASGASAQEWRGGEFRRFDQEKHRFGERCMFRVEARGFAEKKFFGGGGARKAELRAIQHWEGEVSKAFGPQYAIWSRSKGQSARCVPKGIADLECIVSANPCRER